tara:strand:- start:26388 stop:27344 length:957 start_codon:yes stop_codon:yes gene_type:complete
MLLNGVELVDRHNRPGVNQRVGLRMFFINDGVYQDPNDISSVTIFQKDRNTSPSTILNSDGLIDSSQHGSILMHFEPSTTGGIAGVFDATAYTPHESASAIYRVKTGEYVAVLDGTLNLSGTLPRTGDQPYFGTKIANTASAVGDYIDVWTVRNVGASNHTTYIREVGLSDNTFIAITEPLIIRTNNRLTNKHVTLGSTTDMKVETTVSVENRNVDEASRNIFKDSVITNPMFQIVKINENESLAGHLTVSGYSDTSSTIDITSDNTLIFNWNTDELKTMASVATGESGSLLGPYALRVRYTILNETIVTPLMHFIVR